jgi:hypothetical protein
MVFRKKCSFIIAISSAQLKIYVEDAIISDVTLCILAELYQRSVGNF